MGTDESQQQERPLEKKLSQQKRHDFLLQQRDKHLAQFMEINGKAVFTAVVPIVTVLLAVDDVQGKFASAGWVFWSIVACGGAGISMLFLGGLILSTFHTRAIRNIQNRLAGTKYDTVSGASESIRATSQTLKKMISGEEAQEIHAADIGRNEGKPRGTDTGVGGIVSPTPAAEKNDDASQAIERPLFEEADSPLVPVIKRSDYMVIPHNPAANTLIFGGLLAMAAAAMAALVGSMRIVDDSSKPASPGDVSFYVCENKELATSPAGTMNDCPSQPVPPAASAPTPTPTPLPAPPAATSPAEPSESSAIR